MDVSIIIVTYNTKNLTQDCLCSVQKFTDGIAYEIILVDNASTDGSKSVFQEDNSITYIYADKNLGFGRANNLGVERARGNFLLFLNSDTLFKENSIKKLHDFFISNEERLKIGSLGCRLIDQQGVFNGDGSEMPSCKTEIEKYKRIIPIVKLCNKTVVKKSEARDGNYHEIGYVIGADLMMRKEVFNKLGGFDPAYFMYYEESDLQWRMKKLGLQAYIYSGTEIIHLEDGSGKAIKRYNNKKRILAHTSKNIFLKKNDFENYSKYLVWDKLLLFMSRFSKNYTRDEKKDFEIAIRKTH